MGKCIDRVRRQQSFARATSAEYAKLDSLLRGFERERGARRPAYIIRACEEPPPPWWQFWKRSA